MKKQHFSILNFILFLIALSSLSSISLAQEDTWTKKADMPTARTALCTSVVNGKIYAIGGAGTNPAFSAVEEYNPATDTWTKKTNMPTARWAPSTSPIFRTPKKGLGEKAFLRKISIKSILSLFYCNSFSL